MDGARANVGVGGVGLDAFKDVVQLGGSEQWEGGGPVGFEVGGAGAGASTLLGVGHCNGRVGMSRRGSDPTRRGDDDHRSPKATTATTAFQRDSLPVRPPLAAGSLILLPPFRLSNPGRPRSHLSVSFLLLPVPRLANGAHRSCRRTLPPARQPFFDGRRPPLSFLSSLPSSCAGPSAADLDPDPARACVSAKRM